MAVINAFDEFFPDVTISECSLHFDQCIWRRGVHRMGNCGIPMGWVPWESRGNGNKIAKNMGKRREWELHRWEMGMLYAIPI